MSLFEVGGLEAGESHDRIAIDGSAIINGTLQVDLINDFAPAADDTFAVLGANLLFGAYQNVTNGGRVAIEDGSGSFIVNYGQQSPFDPNQVILSDFMLTIFGDFNADGSLNAADIDLLQIGLKDLKFDLTGDSVVDAADRVFWVEEAAGTRVGDVNFDLQVDFRDFLVLADSFGSTGGWGDGDFDGNGIVEFPDFLALAENFGQTSAAAAAVPEPSGRLIAVVGLLGLAGYRRRP